MEDAEEKQSVEVSGESVDGGGKKKKEKKKKSAEERSRDRRLVMWTAIIMLAVSLGFYLWPRLRSGRFELPRIDIKVGDWRVETPSWKGYTETDL